MERLKHAMLHANDALPVAIVASTALSLLAPASFAWFTPPCYAPALGFLMFAVGVNLRPEAFQQVFKTPAHILVGTVGQWVVKPLLGVTLAATLVPALNLPPAIGTGLILAACVSGAQLANYAAFLLSPAHAPLAIVLTALSTAAGVAVTPGLALALLGARLPVNVTAMVASITQIVLLPVGAGLLCSRFAPGLVTAARPLLTVAALLDTCCCVGASLAANSTAARSSLGLATLVPVVVFHWTAFAVGYALARATVARHDVALARCMSLTTGMQSSLLALLLASRFFPDPLVGLPCGLSVIIMTLTGFGLVVFWQHQPAPQLPATV